MTFLEKNLESLTEIIQNSLFAGKIANSDGFLQRLDPRTKILCFILMLLAINLSKNLFFILTIYFFSLLLAYISIISLKFFITRVWIFLPLFTGVIALPAIFNVFTPGKPILSIIDLPQYHLYLSITQNGVLSSLYLIIRAAASVSVSIILVLTTDWHKLLKAFEKLHFPSILIAIILMTYRYIFILLATVNNLFLARKSRMLGRATAKSDRMYLASTLGTLFSKTYAISEEVYQAMKSRGYANRIHIISDFDFDNIDYLIFGITLFMLVLFFIISYRA